ncbi:Ger(x)C family spore germination C-terminal domain-containing protein [Cohnella rhizosphaerae]|uniref:Ger(X)C family spore germination C-terminal domain-containing protein n=1 Tax=Cohnella rhizosphaerae TaxID=1457232 RepID=A0A9X4QR95_9BACL|nr:Ger(x)C family spore germination C-terminal domain-containing protein [Cohnella rhizosphaerae]MDG0808811.1 Ger(x)C family spore germination C-terminal domain-containing protein [Cohnella rhizosphaerae]
MHTFLRDYYDDGAEPVAAIVGETEAGLKVNGIALFVRDRYVAKISADDATYFSLLRGGAKNAALYMDEVDTPRGAGSIALANVTGKRKIKILSPPDPSKRKPARIVVELKLKGSLMEYDDLLELNNIASQPMLERALEKYVADRCGRLIREMQKPGADALGLGQLRPGQDAFRGLEGVKLEPSVRGSKHSSRRGYQDPGLRQADRRQRLSVPGVTKVIAGAGELWQACGEKDGCVLYTRRTPHEIRSSSPGRSDSRDDRADLPVRHDDDVRRQPVRPR